MTATTSSIERLRREPALPVVEPLRHGASGRAQPVIAPSEAFDTVIAYLWKTPDV
jgi:hypothetical protein